MISALYRYPKSMRRKVASAWGKQGAASRAIMRIERGVDAETLRKRAPLPTHAARAGRRNLTMYMIDLPGKPGKHTVEMFSMNVTTAIKMIRRGSIATAAGDHGAINAYRDDAGILRAERSVYMATRENNTFRNLRTLAKWYRLALKRIY